MESQIQAVARLLEEEISHYEKLAAALKKEADYLRQGSPEELLKSVKVVSEHAEAISQIHQDVRKRVEKILNSAGDEKLEKPLRDLMLLLPPQDAQRLQRYQGTLDKLKGWVTQINSRNKAFIQASLDFGKDLFSLLNPGNEASPVYVPQGKRNPPRQLPVSLDRKV
jgi:flagellar biosynthesis/type III secretory pathway chaperone